MNSLFLKKSSPIRLRKIPETKRIETYFKASIPSGLPQTRSLARKKSPTFSNSLRLLRKGIIKKAKLETPVIGVIEYDDALVIEGNLKPLPLSGTNSLFLETLTSLEDLEFEVPRGSFRTFSRNTPLLLFVMAEKSIVAGFSLEIGSIMITSVAPQSRLYTGGT